MLNMLVAIIAALPCGWGIGLIAARLIAGPDFGQLPAVTVPIGLLLALAVAVLPIGPAEVRRNGLLIGAAGFMLLGALTAG